MISLYEISEKYLNVLNHIEIDEETGEVLGWKELEGLETDFDEKAEAIGLFIKSINAEIVAIKEEETKLKKRRELLKNKSDYLVNNIGFNMIKLKKIKISTPRILISFTKSISTVVDNSFVEWAKINANDLLKYEEPTPNKTAIKKAIQHGAQFPLARLQENQNLQIK